MAVPEDLQWVSGVSSLRFRIFVRLIDDCRFSSRLSFHDFTKTVRRSDNSSSNSTHLPIVVTVRIAKVVIADIKDRAVGSLRVEKVFRIPVL